MKIQTFSARDLGPALADQVATDLRAGISAHGRASLAVPGGSTPAPFLDALSGQPLNWDKVAVTLTDERCVPADHARSNQALVARHLLQGEARAATFLPLFDEATAQDDTEAELVRAILPLDVCVLGMGDDMHTASLFPGTPGLAALLDPNDAQHVRQVNPPGADEPRVTLTVRALSTASHTYLLIRGKDKRAALDQAMSMEDRLLAPVRAVLDAATSPIVFYAD